MSSIVIVGAQWGDEGKGKVVDYFSARAEYIVRFQGGANAGHTLVVNGKKTVLHLIPSGILHAGKICLIANGVVFDPHLFFEEIDSLIASGAIRAETAHEVVRVSERAHVILPYHKKLDQQREQHISRSRGEGEKIGTTGKGIGPAYEDKMARRGIRVADLLRPDTLEPKLRNAIEEKNILLRNLFGAPEIELAPLVEECRKLGERLRPFVADARAMVFDAVRRKARILFEGGQGTLLDVDHGTYPFVTSSNTTTGGALTGAGIGPLSFTQVIGITKAYTTRVGGGPFPTEIEVTEPETAGKIRQIGAEFGATTGRMRRVGWLDLVALKYAIQVNGITALAFMKSDVLQDFPEIKVCTAYRLGGKTLLELPTSLEELEKVEPVYATLPGWSRLSGGQFRSRADLPGQLVDYLEFVERECGVPIMLMSTGPGREETLVLQDPYA
jgi:adenylosuccinate synthase